MTIGALAYLLKNQGVGDATVRQLFSQSSINAIRHFALKLPWSGKAHALMFSLGRCDVLERLQRSCKNQQIRNHVINFVFQAESSIHVEGMLYSQYGWAIDLSNQFALEQRELRLENPIAHMNVPASLRDTTQTPDRIVFLNPDFIGQKPNIPNHWRNN